MIFGQPERTGGDLNFVLFGIPVRIHPFFWIVGVLLGPLKAPDPVMLLTWMIAFLLSFLVHELGHALMMRSYGFYPSITLYGMGGMASYGPGQSLRARNPGFLGEISIAAAGPVAGFALAAVVSAAVIAAGYRVEVEIGLPSVVSIGVADLVGTVRLTVFIDQLLAISVIWGVFNLLPIHPLDGGQIVQQILRRLFPADGIRYSLMISLVAAVFMGVVALLQWQSIWSTIVFAYLAYNSYAMLAAYSGRGPWS